MNEAARCDDSQSNLSTRRDAALVFVSAGVQCGKASGAVRSRAPSASPTKTAAVQRRMTAIHQAS